MNWDGDTLSRGKVSPATRQDKISWGGGRILPRGKVSPMTKYDVVHGDKIPGGQDKPVHLDHFRADTTKVCLISVRTL